MTMRVSCQDEVEIVVQNIGRNKIGLSMSDQEGDYVCTWMNKTECQQLIEALMMAAERLQE